MGVTSIEKTENKEKPEETNCRNAVNQKNHYGSLKARLCCPAVAVHGADLKLRSNLRPKYVSEINTHDTIQPDYDFD